MMQIQIMMMMNMTKISVDELLPHTRNFSRVRFHESAVHSQLYMQGFLQKQIG